MTSYLEHKHAGDVFGRISQRSLPTARAAYSDRMSWLMARMSELAYIKFEESDREMQRLADTLRDGGFMLLDTFDNSGTQGFLSGSNDFAVLAFRGTQFNMEDIITDLNFRFYNGTHMGYWEAFNSVSVEVKAALGPVGVPLYITGHSLGGAIAIMATQSLENDRFAACYTFGCPRVGSAEFGETIKTPVYRVVNAADIVARTPFGYRGFINIGDLRYITTGGKLFRNLNIYQHLCRLTRNLIFRWNAPFADHAIGNYRRKLLYIAESRST